MVLRSHTILLNKDVQKGMATDTDVWQFHALTAVAGSAALLML